MSSTEHQRSGEGSTPGPHAAPPLTVTVPALAGRVREVRHAAREYAAQHGADRPDDVALAVAEACSNVVLHAYVGRDVGELRMTGSRELAHVRFCIEDDGGGLVPRADSPGLGLGLPLIAQVTDSFEVGDRGGLGTQVHMRFCLAPST